MDGIFDIEPMLELLMSEDRASVEDMLDTMGDDERLYMVGYLNGYVDACRTISAMEGGMPGLHNASDSDRIVGIGADAIGSEREE